MMLPPFRIDGGMPLALARGTADAGLIAAFGAALYPRFVAPGPLSERTRHRLHLCGFACLGFAALAVLPWLLLETRSFAGDLAPSDVVAVLTDTRFGHLMLLRLALLAAAALAWRLRRGLVACLLSGGALASEAGLSHAVAMGNAALAASDLLHLLAAGAWLGSLVPLWLVLNGESVTTAQLAARRFSPLGLACVLVLLGTAAYQAVLLVGSVPGAIGTDYGWMAGFKALGFATLLMIAARNRFHLTPNLASTRALRRAVAAEIAIGLLVVLAAGVLSQMQPAMHQQPTWPFAVMPSLAAVHEDPDIAREVMEGAALCALFVALLIAAALLRRRWRLRGSLALAGCAALSLGAPHLEPVFVPAGPYAYYRSPTGFSAASIARGAALFPANCAACHGPEGRGNGPLAASLPVPPANLTAAHLFMHSDGELFGWLTDGIDAPEGGQAMPGFGATLSAADRWALIDAIRAHNAGLTAGEQGWARPLQAPAFPVRCRDGTHALADFRGSIVRVVAGAAAPVPGLRTVALGPALEPAPGMCVSGDPEVAHAYALAAGLPALAPGTSVLVDPAGWLRARLPAGSPGLLQALAAIRAHPAAPAAAMPMPMNMKM